MHFDPEGATGCNEELSPEGGPNCPHDKVEALRYNGGEYLENANGPMRFQVHFHFQARTAEETKLWNKEHVLEGKKRAMSEYAEDPKGSTDEQERLRKKMRSAFEDTPIDSSPKVGSFGKEIPNISADIASLGKAKTSTPPEDPPTSEAVDKKIPELPENFTHAAWRAAFDTLVTFGAFPDEPAYDPDYAKKTHQGKRNARAHVRLIDGHFGVDAELECSTCMDNGKKCRVYHPCIGRWDPSDVEWRGKVSSHEREFGTRCSTCRQGSLADSVNPCEAHWWLDEGERYVG